MKKRLLSFIISLSSMVGVNVLASDGITLIDALGEYSPVRFQKGAGLAAKYHIGDFVEGGVVIWLTEDREHGLVAAIEDQSTTSGLKWSTINQTTEATDDSPLPTSTPNPPYGQYYAGYNNQEKIINGYTVSSYPAFQACINYSITLDGKTYDDWFFPSIAELNQMYLMRDVIDSVSLANGGSPLNKDTAGSGVGIYWSSRESGPNDAWFLYFSDGAQYGAPKVNSYSVRCVRAF